MSEVVNESVDVASLALAKFKPSIPLGLLSDEVKFSPEYMSVKRSYNVAFKILQDFNKNSPKEYQKRRSAEWREACYGKLRKKGLTYDVAQ
ncbi:MAG TPA: hypothetical protein EYP92_01280 [Candidatus Thioglobus sp.]|nr:hypothetical protein [Candidatus Thioglobus sp.]